jgi:hypothetical protein
MELDVDGIEFKLINVPPGMAITPSSHSKKTPRGSTNDAV